MTPLTHAAGAHEPMIPTLCEQNDFILLQEHWLTTNDLYKFDSVHKDFTHFSVSAMDSKVSSGILVGRPFGGTSILCRSSLLRYITLIESDSTSGRFISIRYRCGSEDIIITNVYFPTYNTSADYTVECSALIAHIECIIADFSLCKHIIAGDYNSEFKDINAGYSMFKHVLTDYDMMCCDGMSGI